jgi:hypothetical protein
MAHDLDCDEDMDYMDAENHQTSSAFQVEDIRDRLSVLLQNEEASRPRPNYMTEVQNGRLRVQWRMKVAEWLMAVSTPPHYIASIIVEPSLPSIARGGKSGRWISCT